MIEGIPVRKKKAKKWKKDYQAEFKFVNGMDSLGFQALVTREQISWFSPATVNGIFRDQVVCYANHSQSKRGLTGFLSLKPGF